MWHQSSIASTTAPAGAATAIRRSSLSSTDFSSSECNCHESCWWHHARVAIDKWFTLGHRHISQFESIIDRRHETVFASWMLLKIHKSVVESRQRHRSAPFTRQQRTKHSCVQWRKPMKHYKQFFSGIFLALQTDFSFVLNSVMMMHNAEIQTYMRSSTWHQQKQSVLSSHIRLYATFCQFSWFFSLYGRASIQRRQLSSSANPKQMLPNAVIDSAQQQKHQKQHRLSLINH